MDFKKQIEAYIDEEVKVLKALDIESISTAINLLNKYRKNNARIFICGNGGSAATASHYTGDFNKGVSEGLKDKFNFLCLNDNIPLLLSIGNDWGFEHVFKLQIEGRLTPEDLLIVISGSGNSANVVSAVAYAKCVGAKTLSITGYDGGKLKQMADYNLHINIDNMQIAEDVHMILDHLMMFVLRNALIESGELVQKTTI